MSRRLWSLLAVGILVNLVIVLLGPVTTWINTFIQSDAFRHQIEAKASTAAGGTVEISRIGFSFLHGVQLGGVTSKIERPEGTIVSQVASVNCSLSWLALLDRRLQFDGVTLVRPQIVLTQQPPSSVPLPAAPPSSVPAGSSPKAAPASTLLLESASISEGRLSIRDASGATKADLQDVKVHADTSGYLDRKEITGKLAIGTIALPQNLGLTDFTTPFAYRAGALDASPLQASAFGGTLTGGYHLAADSTPSTLEIDGTNFDVAKIASSAHPGAGGPLSGLLSLQSKWQGVETGQLAGEGDAQLANAKLTGVSALHEIARVLQAPALSDPELTSVKVHFQVANGTTRFSGLQIESAVFDITGDGVIDPQGGLNANLALNLHGSAMGGLSGVAAALVSRAGSIPLHLSGTVSDPHTNLSASILNPAPKVERAVDRALSRFLH
jgi:uncharacterized protein involved in outer membrane biogenesis